MSFFFIGDPLPLTCFPDPGSSQGRLIVADHSFICLDVTEKITTRQEILAVTFTTKSVLQ